MPSEDIGPEAALESEPEIVVGTREQLLHLLAEASEIEHTLMCSYLYAAFSLKRAGEPGVSEAQGEALERWRKAIISVAIQEMGHLMIVANLTVAVGGRPHFTRPNFPVSPGYFPSGVAVRLTPFNNETLEHFIFLERPQGLEQKDSEAFEQHDYSREQAEKGLMPSAQDYATIGHLYEAIRANLIALDRQLGSSTLFLGDEGAQISAEIIDLAGVERILDLRSAMDAIDVVIEQGEGSSSDREDSHYRSFLAIRDELARQVRTDPSFAPAWAAAESPVLRRPAEPNGTLFVDSPEAAQLLDFACSSYGLLLRCLVQCFGRPAAMRREEQKLLMSAAIDLMHVVGEASSLLARLPATRRDSNKHAGMTFTMLRGVEPLLPGEFERRLLVERAADLARVGERVLPRVAGQLSKARDALAEL
jgi:ferritin-like protein